MHGKKNLMLWAAVLALALPLLITGTAGAKYMSDGAVSDPTGTAGWILPSDFVCIVGVEADGTLDVADGITSSRDCIYLTTGTYSNGSVSNHPFDLRGMTTSAACTNTSNAGNTADGTAGKAKHAWATSGCWDSSGNAVSLTGLDRTSQMCAAKGGTWVTSGKCVAYVRQFKGQNANGTPKAFGNKGTDSSVVTDMGFCYTEVRMTSAFSSSPTVTDNCPSSSTNASTAYDWRMRNNATSSDCNYNKGIAGYVQAALTRGDGTTLAAAGAFADLSVFTTMGDCLWNGGSWSNWAGKPASTTSVATTPLASTIPVWNYVTQVPDADEGCLHCHSTKAEYNGPAERFKDSYLQTGHKNMLRKVTAGQKYVGADGAVYTTDGTNTIDFTDASITVSGVKQNLYYLYGDWMAALPSVVYGTNGFGSAPGATNGYSCGACHTTGYRDNSNPGTQAMGTPGFGTSGIEPQASFPGIVVNAANPKWDINGITCGRCHNAAVPAVSATMISANTATFTTTAPLGGGMGALASGTGMTNLCFGCHQAIDKVWPAGTVNTTDPTAIPTGVNHGAAWGRDFNGHVLGNSFLNSPHARYTGTIQLNALGKYDLSAPTGTTQYSSEFQGFMCWQSPTSSSPAKTDGAGGEIKDKATCESLYGAGSWRSDNQGTCSTCHDVHNSLFVASQEEAAMRKKCDDCHHDSAYAAAVPQAVQIDMSAMSHPGGTNGLTGTPFDPNYKTGPCVVCHMATQAQQNGNQNSMPVHVWRINTKATYSTWPSVDEFNGTNGATKTRSAKTDPETYWGGTYNNAVWVDLDMACGQCHGGSLGSGATANNARYISKTNLAKVADGIHDPASKTCLDCHSMAINHKLGSGAQPPAGIGACQSCHLLGGTGTLFTDYAHLNSTSVQATCGQCHWGDGGAGAALVASAPSFSLNLLQSFVVSIHTPTVLTSTVAPVVGHGTVTQSSWTVTFTDSSTDADGTQDPVTVSWGDGAVTKGLAGDTFSHTYPTTAVRTYYISHLVTDPVNAKLISKETIPVNVPQRFQLVTKVTNSAGGPLTGAQVSLQTSGHTVKFARLVSSNTATFTNVLPNTYTVKPYMYGVTFPAPVPFSLGTNTTITIKAINR